MPSKKPNILFLMADQMGAKALSFINGQGAKAPNLEALAARPGVIKSRNQLMDAAYPDDIFVDDRTVDSHIKRMRRKFRSVDPEFGAIDTLYGAGYSFSDG